MPPWLIVVLVAAGLVALGAILYWQLIIAEGVYLGQRVVTWLYDLAARRYDDIKQYDDDMEAVFLGRPLADMLRPVPGALVLDIATGTGRLPLALFEQPAFRGRVIGVDASRSMLEIAAQKLRGNEHRLMLLWRDASSLPFADGAFDAVTVLEMLEFTPDPATQLAEAVRVLRPGGILVTTRRRGWNAALMPGKTHSPDEFRALLESLGLTRVELLPWQVDYDLVWAVKPGHVPSGARHMLDVLHCPACRSAQWEEHPAELCCGVCHAAYPVKDGIIDIRGKQ
ncbi:MAG: methyltransferase domain-containing protein [Aggregatilineales bacterium]|jgi:SAM-dependent methyltransferase|nr:methyltransferase domain-containing protein [Chloroflexota bacterium]HOA22724.1 methyltransferase domain-containing protein [Aggregatilineales bacterium]HPV07585.1 methyltransferase domain-containing protein [Aggregatilineales bacterium]HQE19734.1 methyltransferase domain-containing protein [Aggregatilineales bacterium]